MVKSYRRPGEPLRLRHRTGDRNVSPNIPTMGILPSRGVPCTVSPWGLASLNATVANLTSAGSCRQLSQGRPTDLNLQHEHCEGRRSLRAPAWISGSTASSTAQSWVGSILPAMSAAMLQIYWLTVLTKGSWELLHLDGQHPLMAPMTQAGKFLERGLTAPDIQRH